MDIKEYISSGIIEAYVMGIASEEEVRILDCIQKNNPAVKQAILDAQLTLEDFASKQAISPPPALKAAIWAKISEESEEKKADEESVTTPVSVSLYPTSSVDNKSNNLKWFAIAASLLLIVSISLNFYLKRTQNDIKNQLADLKIVQKGKELAYQNLKSKLDMANNPMVKTIPLLGVEKHPNMKAMVYFEQHSKDVYLALENLPIAPKGQQYQLWAMVDGKPVSLGVFNQDAEGAMQKMAPVETAQAFAITLEKRGGSLVPTMDQMYVMGKVERS